MSKLQIFEDEFPGEKAWEAFYGVFSDDWSKVKDKDTYLKVIPDESVAAVLAVKMGDRIFNWFSTPSHALDEKTPQQIFLSGPRGTVAIKTLIMRMP